MGVRYFCDVPECPFHRPGVLGSFDGYMWNKPKGWRSLPLDDLEIHGCCDDHYERAVALPAGNTPLSGSHPLDADL